MGLMVRHRTNCPHPTALISPTPLLYGEYRCSILKAFPSLTLFGLPFATVLGWSDETGCDRMHLLKSKCATRLHHRNHGTPRAPLSRCGKTHNIQHTHSYVKKGSSVMIIFA